MANEKRLLDANDFLDKLSKLAELMRQGEIGEIDLNLLIASMPTVDAVEVVRCKDCTNKRKAVAENGQIIFCSIWGRGWCRVDPNDFCSYGGRRTDG